MRLANEIAAAAMEHVQGVLRPGMTCAQAAAEWQGFVHGEGTGWNGQVELALPVLARLVGPEHQDVHGDDGRPGRRGRADALRDLGLRRRLLGRPHEEPLPGRAHRRATRSCSTSSTAVYDDAVAFARPGASLAELDRRVREGIAAAGYPGQPSHPICHGIGARAHEPPYAHQAGGGEIAESMVLAIEPGIYWPEGGGLRLEDNFLITADGAEKLSPFPDGVVAMLTARSGPARSTTPHAIGGSVGLYDTTLRDGEQTVGVVLDPSRSSSSPARSTRSGSSGSRPASRASRRTTGTP